MDKAENKTYYYNFVGGVTPAEIDGIEYDYDVSVISSEGNYTKAVARLEINNNKSVAEYQEDLWGYFVEGVDSWYKGHQYLIDLVQAMLEELVRKTPVGCEVREYTAVINEIYSDGTFIDYVIDIDLNTFDENLYLECSEILAGEITDQATLSQLINIKAEALYHKYLC